MEAGSTQSLSPYTLVSTRLLSGRGRWMAAHLVLCEGRLVRSFPGRKAAAARALVAAHNAEVAR